MKLWNQQAIIASLLALAMVFSLTGCTKTNTGTTSEYPSTGQSEVREMTDQGRAGVREAVQTAEANLQKIATSSNQAMKELGIKGHYGQEEEKEFLSACKQSCANERPTSDNVAQFCDLYCGCTHDNLKVKVPLKDLQAYSNGQPSQSNQAIREIRNQCVRDSHAATQKSSEGQS
jgi:hypothetical protein